MTNSNTKIKIHSRINGIERVTCGIQLDLKLICTLKLKKSFFVTNLLHFPLKSNSKINKKEKKKELKQNVGD